MNTPALEKWIAARKCKDDAPRVLAPGKDAKDPDLHGIDLRPNVVAWLRTISFRSGPILPKGGMGSDRNHIAAVRPTVGAWHRNTGRQSYLSDKAGRNGDFAAAEDAGHESVRLTRKHYKALVSKRAEAYFSIVPSGGFGYDPQLCVALTFALPADA